MGPSPRATWNCCPGATPSSARERDFVTCDGRWSCRRARRPRPWSSGARSRFEGRLARGSARRAQVAAVRAAAHGGRPGRGRRHSRLPARAKSARASRWPTAGSPSRRNRTRGRTRSTASASTLEDRDGRATIVVRHGGVANVTRPPQAYALGGGAADGRPPADRGRALRAARREVHDAAGAAPCRQLRGAGLAALAVVGVVLLYLFTATAGPGGVQSGSGFDERELRGHVPRLRLRRPLSRAARRLPALASRPKASRRRASLSSSAACRASASSSRSSGCRAASRSTPAASPRRSRWTARTVGALPGEYELPAGTRELAVTAPHLRRGAPALRGHGRRRAAGAQGQARSRVFARVTVTSVPAGATVWADDRELGTTPLETELDAGRYTLAIVHPEFRRFESPLTVVAGQPLAVGPVELGMPDGRLVVQSRPAGADVSIGGRYRGRTPLTVGVPPGMPQDVLLTLAGHAPATQSVTVESRAERRIAVELRPMLGEVRVKGEPADAILYVDGASRGPANQVLSLPAAPHVFEVRKSGLEPFRATVTPQEGRTQVRRVRAEDGGRSARRRQCRRQQATSLGQPLVLVKRRPLHDGQPAARAGPPLERDRAPGRAAPPVLHLALPGDEPRVPRVPRPAPLRHLQGRVARPRAPAGGARHLAGRRRVLQLAVASATSCRRPTCSAATASSWSIRRRPATACRPRRSGSSPRASTAPRAMRKYPWGNDLPVPAKAGNWGDATRDLSHAGHDLGLRRRPSRVGARRQLPREPARPA